MHHADGCENGIDQIVRTAIDSLGRAGAVLKDKPLPEGRDAFAVFAEGSVSAIELRVFLDRELPDWLATIDPINVPAIKDTENLSAREYLTRLARLREVAKSVAGRFDDVEVIAMPTVIVTPHVLTEESGPEKCRARNRT
jgi:aspartyl-tRNA(Asn)/glutamyl-tRNA(Gln) amidotransferase subunit A